MLVSVAGFDAGRVTGRCAAIRSANSFVSSDLGCPHTHQWQSHVASNTYSAEIRQ